MKYSTDIDTLKSYFQTGDKPTEAQFADLIDSFMTYDTVFEASYKSKYIKTHNDNSLEYHLEFNHAESAMLNNLTLVLLPTMYYIPNMKYIYGDSVFVNMMTGANVSTDAYQRVLISETFDCHAFMSNVVKHTVSSVTLISYIYADTSQAIGIGSDLTWSYGGVLYGHY